MKYSNPERLIVHGSHHKVGTVWFNRILGGMARSLNWKCHIGRQEYRPPDASIFIEEHSRIDADNLPPFVGSHIIRDPRDVVISGYYYHLKCCEKWCIQPKDKFDGRSYQSVLRDLDVNDGIDFEMRNVGRNTLKEMLSWDYRQACFFEIRYEQLLDNEKDVFTSLFKHYGLNPAQIEVGLELVEKYSFKNAKKNSNSEIHLRSGKVNQWRLLFSKSHIESCKSLYGDGLIALGYEKDLNW